MQQQDSLDTYLQQYGPFLAERARTSLDPVHTPGKDPLAPAIASLKRPPFEAQAHVITGVARALDQQQAVFIVGEMGTGKTMMGMAAVHAHANGRPYRALVFCPGHLTRKWKREILETIPNATVAIWSKHTDVINRAVRWREAGKPKPMSIEWYVISRDRAKLSAKWRSVTPTLGELRCPRCGQVQLNKDNVPLDPKVFAKRRQFCFVDECKEALFQYTGELRRWEPASIIHRQMRGFLDYAVIDEVHEEKGGDTAQANAAGTIAASAKRTLALTGTLIGGYAEHLRPLMFRLSPTSLVAEGFEWKNAMPFVEQYGMIETRITEKESESGDANSQSRGSSKSTSRICRPGIMPSLFGAHLLDKTVFLLLDDVAANLPELDERIVPVQMTCEHGSEYDAIASALRNEIGKLMAVSGPMAARKLTGKMLTALLAYPDFPFQWDTIGYDSGESWIPVCQPRNLDPSLVYPKEQKLLDLVQHEYNLGRQVWVFVLYNDRKNVQTRLARMLAGQGLRVAELRADVELAAREAWIAEHGPKHDVILSNADLVKTGLDLFDKGGKHNFSTLIFYETGYDLFTLRQASRRAWRIGQPAKCKVMYLYYQGTMQETALSLMGKKLAAAQSLDGRFSSEGLTAMSEDSLEAAMARSLVEQMDEDASREWGKIGAKMQEEPTDDVIECVDMEDADFYSDLSAMLDTLAV